MRHLKIFEMKSDNLRIYENTKIKKFDAFGHFMYSSYEYRIEDVYEYKHVNFSWYKNSESYVVVIIDNIVNNSYNFGCSALWANVGKDIQDVKENIDKYYIEKETNKYNL